MVLLVSFDDFKRIDLRIAKILNVEDIPGKDRIYKIEIDLGNEKRTIVAGIKQSYAKEDLFGKQIVVVANLEPRPMAGFVSNGMLLAVKIAEDNHVLLTVESDVAAGTRVE